MSDFLDVSFDLNESQEDIQDVLHRNESEIDFNISLCSTDSIESIIYADTIMNGRNSEKGKTNIAYFLHSSSIFIKRYKLYFFQRMYQRHQNC